MISSLRPIDLKKCTPQQLKNHLENNRKHGQTEMVHAVLAEMARRGLATSRDYQNVTWNQDRVREVLRSFQEVATTVKDNQRTTYTEAGGRRIGRPKDDPGWFWIDSYSAIKTDEINAIFACRIKRVGDDPSFELHIDRTFVRSFNADQLPDALVEWQRIAARKR